MCHLELGDEPYGLGSRGLSMSMPDEFDPRRYLRKWEGDPLMLREALWQVFCEDYVDAGMPYGMSTLGVVVWLEEQ